ncbi:MAG TPA: phenylalanine--tRNA ligase subunit beta [Candidatus Scatomorpha stercorigallinarum]|nr:phenylalanine--tRNA ligase subunit beta [Candidatus Scatomorpha stercorigallinarum]
MDLSRKWLTEFIDVGLDEINDHDFAEAMTMSGSKVEDTHYMGEGISNVVVGRIVEMVRHHDSDHMWTCQVDVGGKRLLQIVTGAQNQKVGDLVPVALDGATLPGGAEIHTTTFRGELSEGMMCSIKELGLTLHDFPYAIEDGLFILQEDCRPGDDIVPVIGRDDHVVEFEITPNRPDCLSVIGLAREASVTFQKPLKLHTPVVKGSGGDIHELVKVDVEDAKLCPRYTARMVRNIKIEPSPKWMRERISAMGMRPINNIVDITNYVMMEYGQPMHAFDFSCVDGGHIIVRTAREGETCRTLDGNERKVTPNMLCICDEHKPVGLAGVMGGENSEITPDTKMVLFESANFNGTSIRRTAAALNMRTDASAHYEKGLDPYLTKIAVDRACELVELLGAGEVVDGYVDVFPDPPKPLVRKLDVDRVNWILGTDIDGDTMRKILSDLGFQLDGNTVTVPSWRLDIDPKYTQNDFAEEVARIYGFNNIPSTMMADSGTKSGGYTPEQAAERRLGETCRANGYDSIITYSFYSPAGWDMIRLPENDPRRDAIRILNPLGEDTSCMRTTTLPSVLEVLARNWNFRNKAVRIYEFAKVYKKRPDGMADEPKVLTLGAYGVDMDFYSLKGTVEELCDALRISGVEYVPVRDDPSYHPGRCAAVYAGGEYLGRFGQVHPLVAKNYGVSEELYTAELDFPAMFAHRTTELYYAPLPRFPAVMRDISLVCDDALTAGELEKCIRRAGGEYLESVEVFDVYKGVNIPEGKKSISFALALRAGDQTLTDDHADEAVAAILGALAREYGAVIR